MPDPLTTIATVQPSKESPALLADALVYGPLLLFGGLGKDPPKWVRVGMVVAGVATIAYSLYQYFDAQRANGLSGMSSGPMHKMDPRFHRPIIMG